MRLKAFTAGVGLALLFTPATATAESSPRYDIIIKNARIFEGSLRPAFSGEVAIQGDEIAAVAEKIEGDARRIIDAGGMYLTPGFIDLHTHAERNMYFPEHRAASNYLRQGVTTLVVGQCGQSAWPMMEKPLDQIDRWRRGGIGPNAALLVGHGTVRRLVMGMERRAPTAEELERMKDLVREAMKQGASGMSTGLIYLPGRYADTEEIISLVEVVAEFGGIYHSHIRNERERLLDSVEEAIEISRRTGVRVHISHFKVMGRSNWGTAGRACEKIDRARAEGLAITADQYPFRFANGDPYRRMIPAGVWRGERDPDRFTDEDVGKIFNRLADGELISLYEKVTPYLPLTESHRRFLNSLPHDRLSALVGETLIDISRFRGAGNPRERMLFLERFRDPKQRPVILRSVHDYIENLVGFDNFMVAICNDKRLEGLSLREASRVIGNSPAETAIMLELMGARCIPMQMTEEDIETIMRKDYVGTGSDGVCPNYGMGPAHIRAYVTFLHKIRKYALERKAVSVAHVIRSQTSLPAKIMNLPDRGWIRAGCKADIVIIDLDNLGIRASLNNPHQYSEGVIHLLINGTPVIQDGEPTGALPGRVLLMRSPDQRAGSESGRPTNRGRPRLPAIPEK